MQSHTHRKLFKRPPPLPYGSSWCCAAALLRFHANETFRLLFAFDKFVCGDDDDDDDGRIERGLEEENKRKKRGLMVAIGRNSAVRYTKRRSRRTPRQYCTVCRVFDAENGGDGQTP